MKRLRNALTAAKQAVDQANAAANGGVDPRLTGKVLLGPAGEVMHGVSQAPQRPPEIEDPAAWDAQMRTERAVRDAVRAPYLALGRRPVRITRVATRGKTQVREVADHLGSSGLAARPDLVYGVYRVPDLISPGRLGGEKGGIVEWDVVHAAETALPAAEAPAILTLDARDVVVARAPGDPRPLDEEVALAALGLAGAGAERTLGIARAVTIAKRGGGDDSSSGSIDATVTGVHVLAAPGVPLSARGVPWQIAHGSPPGICIDVLQWDAIARAVHPVRQRRAPLPSPYPYLPLTPQELLRAYLEIVGVAPGDAYSAQVTHDPVLDLMSRTSLKRGVRRTGGGPDLPCADGKARKRMAGGHHVVVAYRDRPEYAEGRARFNAYAEVELQAHLRRNLGLHAPVPKPAGRLLRTAERAAAVIDFFQGDYESDDEQPPRYCWPPRRA